MRLGIMGSGYEVAYLAACVPDEVEVVCFVDWAMWPWTSKSLDDIVFRFQKGVDELVRREVTHMIVPPYAEYLFRDQVSCLYPLFEHYLLSAVLPASRVGKLGVMTMHGASGRTVTEALIHKITEQYQLTDYQRTTPSFVKKFPCRMKDCAHRQTHLLYNTKRSRIMNKLIKDDLRYFKDCAVDTLIPLDRGLLYREKTIRHRLGAKMRFFGQATIRELCLRDLGGAVGGETTGVYGSCQLLVTAYPEDIREKKQRKQLLDRGGKRPVELVRIG